MDLDLTIAKLDPERHDDHSAQRQCPGRQYVGLPLPAYPNDRRHPSLAPLPGVLDVERRFESLEIFPNYPTCL